MLFFLEIANPPVPSPAWPPTPTARGSSNAGDVAEAQPDHRPLAEYTDGRGSDRVRADWHDHCLRVAGQQLAKLVLQRGHSAGHSGDDGEQAHRGDTQGLLDLGGLTQRVCAQLEQIRPARPGSLRRPTCRRTSTSAVGSAPERRCGVGAAFGTATAGPCGKFGNAARAPGVLAQQRRSRLTVCWRAQIASWC